MKVEFTFRSGSRVIAEVENFYVDDDGSYVWVDLPEDEREGRRILADVNYKAVDAVVIIEEED